MWLYNPATGRTELIHDEAHIKRMLDEGCRQVSDPRVEAQPPTQENNVTPLRVVDADPEQELESAESGKEAHRRRYISKAK